MSKIGAFLIHPRDRVDMEKYNWLAHLVPTPLLKWYCKHKKPGIVSHVRYKDMEIYLVGVFSFPTDLTRQDVLRGAKFAVEKLGAQVVGLGALTACVTAGGKWLLDKLPSDAIVTNGNSLTAAMTVEGVQKAAALKGWNLNSNTTIAILGATGSVGTGVSHLLIEDLAEPKLLLVGRSLRKLDALEHELKSKNPQACIETSANIADVRKAGMIIVLTSGPDVLLEAKHLRHEAVVYDITQPSNISPEILKKRHDLLVIDGALVTTPDIDWGFDLRLPEETSFACLAETIFLAENGEHKYTNYDFTSTVNVETARAMARAAGKHGFTHAPLTSFRRLVLKEAMKEQIYLVKEKYLNKMSLLL
ncbi:MAG: hypothetical protein ABIG90_00330 [bacterium]